MCNETYFPFLRRNYIDAVHLQNQQHIYRILQEQQKQQQEILNIIKAHNEREQKQQQEILNIIKAHNEREQKHEEEILKIIQIQNEQQTQILAILAQLGQRHSS